MSNAKKIIIITWLIISSLIISVGYAAYSTTLHITGETSATPAPFKGVYIYDVQVVPSGSAKSNSYEYIHPTTLKTDVEASSNSTITYEITVHNNTDATYWYLGMDLSEKYGNNTSIGGYNGITITTKESTSDTTQTFDDSDWVPPQTMRKFYVTFKFGSGATGKNIQNLVVFNFGTQILSVKDEFLKVLNDKTSEYGYKYLVEEIEKNYAESGSTSIGNIGEDKQVFNNLFGPNLTVNVDGENKPVTIIVDRKNVDGKTTGDSYSNANPSGCEYTLYITVDNLDGSTATVYAVSYTCGSDGVWRQLGELYEGTSSTEPYDNSGNMGLDVESWRAVPKTYTLADGITYKVGYIQGSTEANNAGANGTDFWRTINELMGDPEATKGQVDNNFYNNITNKGQDLLLKPVCLIIYSYKHGSNGQWVESDNTANMNKEGYAALKKAFDKIKPYCYIGNGAQEVKIQNATTLPRAEIVPMFEEIYNAYQYYLSVN